MAEAVRGLARVLARASRPRVLVPSPTGYAAVPARPARPAPSPDFAETPLAATVVVPAPEAAVAAPRPGPAPLRPLVTGDSRGTGDARAGRPAPAETVAPPSRWVFSDDARPPAPEPRSRPAPAPAAPAKPAAAADDPLSVGLTNRAARGRIPDAAPPRTPPSPDRDPTEPPVVDEPGTAPVRRGSRIPEALAAPPETRGAPEAVTRAEPTPSNPPPVVIGQIDVHVAAPEPTADPFAGSRYLAAGATTRRGGGW